MTSRPIKAAARGLGPRNRSILFYQTSLPPRAHCGWGGWSRDYPKKLLTKRVSKRSGNVWVSKGILPGPEALFHSIRNFVLSVFFGVGSGDETSLHKPPPRGFSTDPQPSRVQTSGISLSDVRAVDFARE